MKGKAAPFRMTAPKRGPAAAEAQLSDEQRALLLWLLIQEEGINNSDNKQRIIELNQKGIPWSPKRFYDDVYEHAMPRSKASSISNSLRALEDNKKKKTPRLLVERYDSAGGVGKKPRTSHVKLTSKGRYRAHYEREHGMSRRQYETRERLARQLDHLRSNLPKFLHASGHLHEASGPFEVRDPWDWDQSIHIDSLEFKQALHNLITELNDLATALELPLTEEEASLLQRSLDNSFTHAP